jgi:hypothetical protein
MRDYRTAEVEELRLNLRTASNEVSMQGALIIALTRKVTELERIMDQKDASYHASLETLQRAIQEERARADLKRAPLPEAESLRRALLAEAEVSKLKLALSAQTNKSAAQRTEAVARQGEESGSADSRYRVLRDSYDQVLAQKRKMDDELLFLREENARLERQVELMRADLEARVQQPSPQIQHRPKESPQLRSDAKHFGDGAGKLCINRFRRKRFHAYASHRTAGGGTPGSPSSGERTGREQSKQHRA